MKYIDSGGRDPAHALGAWLANEASGGIEELRLQSGYFGIDGLSPLVQTLARMAARDAPVKIVIGSNAGETPAGDVETLIDLTGLPRTNASLAIVQFGNALFHSKTWHLVRSDGSEAAYVGSANVGKAAVSGLNVEAGLLLDERDGDPSAVIKEIAAAVDRWFTGPLDGVELVTARGDVTRLVASGWVAKVRPPQITPASAAGTGGTRTAKLAPLLALPPVPRSGGAGAAPTAAGISGPTTVSPPALATSAGYPATMRFSPSPLAPTTGLATLSHLPLPNGAAGLVIRLSKDTARHWTGGSGTANISLPIPTLEPLRFGMYNGVTPRAEPGFRSRFVGLGGVTRVPNTTTSVMAYGYGPNPTGHKDVRMVLPKPSAVALAQAASNAGSPVPGPGDYALLEWPTPTNPSFGLTVMDTGSPLYATALALASSAIQTRQLVGGSSCWLPAGISPAW